MEIFCCLFLFVLLLVFCEVCVCVCVCFLWCLADPQSMADEKEYNEQLAKNPDGGGPDGDEDDNDNGNAADDAGDADGGDAGGDGGDGGQDVPSARRPPIDFKLQRDENM